MKETIELEKEANSMDFETKVEILKANGFEECGDRRMAQYFGYNKYPENRKKNLIEKSNECSFLLKFDEDGVPRWYSEEYIRNTDIDKILYPFNSEDDDLI